MSTDHTNYDDELMQTIEADQTDMRLATSTLALFSLKNAFYEGSYTVRTTNLEKIME